jgi:thioredoxin-related protein
MMNKVVASVIAGLVVLTGGFLVFSNQDSGSNNSQLADTSIQPNSNSETTELDSEASEEIAATNLNSANGLGYVEYSEQTLADSSNSKRVLFFHAPWCSVCNFYEGQIEDQPVPADVTILKIDYDSEDALKQQYKVTTQSTFVLLDSEGNIVESWPFARGLNGINDLYSQI